MERITKNLNNLTPEQKLMHTYLDVRLAELLANNLKCRLVIDIQNGRINSIQDQEQMSGLSQTSYKLKQMGIDTNKLL